MGTLNIRDLKMEYVVLCDEREALKEDIKFDGDVSDLEDWDFHNLDDMNELSDLMDQLEGCCGSTLVEEFYFDEYIKELCIDCGDVPESVPWYIKKHIDWESVAGELKGDYGTVIYHDTEYIIV